jgi:hypothetical protein
MPSVLLLENLRNLQINTSQAASTAHPTTITAFVAFVNVTST